MDNKQYFNENLRFLTIISFKVQLITSGVFMLGLLIDYTPRVQQNFIQKLINYGLNIGVFLFLWQVAFQIFKTSNYYYPLPEFILKHIILALSTTFGVAHIITFSIEWIVAELSGNPMPPQSELMVDSFVTFLLLSMMIGAINLVLFFRFFKQKQDFEALQKQNQNLELLLSDVADVIQVIDATGKIFFTSLSIKKLLELSSDKSIPTDFRSWICPKDVSYVTEKFQAFVMGQENKLKIEYNIYTSNLIIKSVESIGIKTKLPDLNEVVIITTRDISDRKASEMLLLNENQSYKLLLDISKLFLSISFIEALRKSLEELGGFVGVDRVYIYLLDDSEKWWNCIHEWKSKSGALVDSVFSEKGVSSSQINWLLDILSQNKPLAISNREELPANALFFKKMLEADSTKSILVLPMKSQEKLIGFIGYDTIEKYADWQEEDILTLQVCKEIVTSAIIRNQAESITKQSLSLNKAIVESTSEGILLTDLDTNIITYNASFKAMWHLDTQAVSFKCINDLILYIEAFLENSIEVIEMLKKASDNSRDTHYFLAKFKNKSTIECICVPQVIDGIVVGRIWSNRNITARMNSEREEMEKGLALAQFESLKNQVNPHFLFNSLNVLSSLVHIDAELSEKFIIQLAKSYRYLLEQKDKELVMLKTEVEFVEAFSFLLKIRFEDKLQIKLNLQNGNLDDLIAPLTLQLVIENAVKHNIISREKPLLIEIYVDDSDVLIIRNNLQLRVQQMPSTGVGLKNILNRYKLLTNRIPQFVKEANYYIEVILTF